ncbi:MAG: hypothetical protein ACRD0Z_12910 [Acidimicrobiales bacterium]
MTFEPSDDDAGAALRAQFQEMVAGVTPDGDVYETVRRKQAKQQRVRLAGASTALLVAAGVGVPLGLASGGAPPQGQASATTAQRPKPSTPTLHGPLIRLDALTVSLPASYRLVKATSTSCDVGAVGFSWTAPTRHGGAVAYTVPDYSTIQTAATSSGACVTMLATPPETPGPADAPPDWIDPSTASTVQVGSYTGTVGVADQVFGSPPAGTLQFVLEVQVSTSGGDIQELGVIAAGLTEDQLVSIVSEGLQ